MATFTYKARRKKRIIDDPVTVHIRRHYGHRHAYGVLIRNWIVVLVTSPLGVVVLLLMLALGVFLFWLGVQ